ncbi:hypothetical protein MAIT1_01522 [Magnetofaba australis IT-1]|uniref:Uncharacterized protein n=2 Tax=Magnetofaba TaxID=1472292 RepID=A0A1Y2K0H3_9PROT|nr:hypothetical protein MAIT1_01522 [Magnetofaba australis IT-1]
MAPVDEDLQQTVDEIRDDSLFEVGTVHAWSFPPQQAEAAAHQAWERMASVFTDTEMKMLEGLFYASAINGTERDASVDFSNPEFAYRAHVTRMRRELENTRSQIKPGDYIQRHMLLEAFEAALGEAGAN